MKIAVVGSRTLNVDMEDYLGCEVLTELVSGGARGIDSLAEQYARSKKIPIKIFRPDYHAYGRIAPLMRNRDIVAYADMVIAIWDGHSRGTKNAIKHARQQKKPLKIFILPSKEAPTLFPEYHETVEEI